MVLEQVGELRPHQMAAEVQPGGLPEPDQGVDVTDGRGPQPLLAHTERSR
jgi:hypothetical protein